MKYKLSEISNYVTDKVDVEAISISQYISTENMLEGKKGIKTIEKMPNVKRVTAFKKKDILISNIRPYFKKIWFAEFDGGCSSDVLVFRSKDIVTSEFLFTLLLQDTFFHQMVLSSKGTKMPRGDKKAIMNLEFYIPNISIQNKISQIIFNIKEKIELNNQMIDTLEEIASTLFKRWFVDFEFPDENGNPYKSSGGKMIDSEFGEIPDGWEIKRLSEIANYKNGLAMQKFRPLENEDSLPVLKIKELNQGYTDQNSDRCSIDINEDVKVYDGDIIFSWSGTLIVDIWTGGNAGLNQHLFKVTSEKYSKWFYYLWTKFYLNKFIAIAKDKATTMGHIKRQHLNESLVCVPKDFELLNQTFEGIINKVENLGKSNRDLEQMRDLLLPKLLSGEIKV